MVELYDQRLPVRFWDKVAPEPNTGCWLWLSTVNNGGYAKYQVGASSTRYAHRVAYQTLVGNIPQGMVLDHLCCTRSCVNPNHLEPVTTSENLSRGETLASRNRAKTHCPYGHPYSGNNLVYEKGHRVCRECRRIKSQKKNAKRHKWDKRYCKNGHYWLDPDIGTLITKSDGSKYRRCNQCRREKYARTRRT